MEAADPSKRALFCNILHAAAQDIAKGLSDNWSTAAYWH